MYDISLFFYWVCYNENTGLSKNNKITFKRSQTDKDSAQNVKIYPSDYSYKLTR